MSWRVGAYPAPNDITSITVSNTLLTNDAAFCSIVDTPSRDGVMWLNIHVNTSARVDELIVILH